MGTGNDQSDSGSVFVLGERPRTDPKVERIATYWETVRGNRLVPERSEIDPRGLEGTLGHAFILERITGGLARFRIAGSHLNQLTGLELRQMPISALFVPGSREVLADALVAVFEEPAIVRMQITSPGGFGRTALQGDMVLLPLRSDLGDVDRVLGGLVMDGKIGRTPRRFEVVSQSRKSLTGYVGTTRGAPVLPARETLQPPALQEKQVTPATPVVRGHLKLVVSNT
ncbi:MAG: PAS domain-containing protein [Pseudomonadota bacterium]